MTRKLRSQRGLVQGSTRLTITLVIVALAMGGILIAQHGVFSLVRGEITVAIPVMMMGTGLVIGAVVLGRYRNELVDE